MLVLFDIDGTLLANASREHAQAIHEAIAEVHGVDVAALRRPGPEVAGRTDGEIARILLTRAGVGPGRIDALADAVRERACARYCELCPPDLTAARVPGIASVLEALSARDDRALALVTGNFEPVARLKLKRAGLGHFFAAGQGGFGSDAEDRAALPAVARRRAGGVSPRNAVVVGDTPRDIACARADGCRVIAVTSGPYGADALGGADAVAEDAEALTALLTDGF
ncbi:HAD family hydrolase [Conexibacter sp. DBS9H8]|uniref:HAD family hydrolase n=1 Tax=Conexibacter sp. DBS9H8 TaxID=2937801 RepID=UPI00200EEAF9|nr:haloacid dehalogenase-like hydrolase [Conexibacter sp. DBS9H8]